MSNLKKREETRYVPPAVQELEVASEPCDETKQQSTEAVQMENSPSRSGDVSAPAASGTSVCSQQDSSSSPAICGDQAGAANSKSKAG